MEWVLKGHYKASKAWYIYLRDTIKPPSMVHVLMATIKAPSEGTCIKGLLKSLLVMVHVLKDHCLVFW